MVRLRLLRFLFTLIALLGFVTPVYADNSIRVGMEADDIVTRTLFNSIAEQFQLPVEYIYYPSFNDILTAVESGESDFAANVTYTDHRAERFDFSRPTNIEYTYLYSLTGATLDSIERVGVPHGTIYSELIAKNYPELTLVEYSGHIEARQLLEQGSVDGVVDAINQLKPMLLGGFDAQLLNHQLSIKPVSLIATKNKHQQSLLAFQEFIHSAKVQKSLRESVSQYQFELRRKALRGMVTQAGIDRSKPLKVKIEQIGQYAQYHDNGKVTGVTPEVLFSACDILQVNCQLVSNADETWESMFGDFLAKDIDILSPLAISEPRKNVAYFSQPYYTSTAIMIKREGYKDNVYSNVSELIVERIGVVKNDIYHEVLADLLPQKKLYTYNSNAERVTALLNKEIDYVVISRSSFNKVLRESQTLLPIVEDKFIGEFYSTNIAIGFSKTEMGKTLAPLFTQAITMLDLERIVRQHYILPDWRATLQSEQRLARLSISIIIMVLIASILVSLYLNHQSKTDNLTRLKNRRALKRRYSKGIPPEQTLVYLDVNKFKPINDTYGHEIGDQVLKEIAKNITRYWKGQSYRIGGDEFILTGVASGVELSYALLNLQKIAFTSNENAIALDISLAFGVSQPRGGYMSLEDVMHEADLSMYANKRKVNVMESFRDLESKVEESASVS
ncbi:transporter substrate-binding domain-containing protein [Vibrio sp. 404]|uniref:Transporter substrate-binding domain-containing protein n=1 Tax=Vibrio marinisediminis TaxID=2758441 RepID=A0A7W2FPA5_9VIBR|nr:transporter substrate-binding domain-containing protein [Vibrio marinisediminis]